MEFINRIKSFFKKKNNNEFDEKKAKDCLESYTNTCIDNIPSNPIPDINIKKEDSNKCDNIGIVNVIFMKCGETPIIHIENRLLCNELNTISNYFIDTQNIKEEVSKYPITNIIVMDKGLGFTEDILRKNIKFALGLEIDEIGRAHV